jgi:aspartate racemase
MSARKVVGVLGGMGPDATVDFFAKLVAATHGDRDQDRLRILIDNDPTVPDRTAGIEGRGPSPAPHLAAMARGLVAQGAELLVMPCNSAHAFADAIAAAAAPVPFVDLIETTVAATRARLPAASARRAAGHRRHPRGAALPRRLRGGRACARSPRSATTSGP